MCLHICKKKHFRSVKKVITDKKIFQTELDNCYASLQFMLFTSFDLNLNLNLNLDLDLVLSTSYSAGAAGSVLLPPGIFKVNVAEFRKEESMELGIFHIIVRGEEKGNDGHVINNDSFGFF